MKLCYDHDEVGTLYMWIELENDEQPLTDKRSSDKKWQKS